MAIRTAGEPHDVDPLTLDVAVTLTAIERHVAEARRALADEHEAEVRHHVLMLSYHSADLAKLVDRW